MFDLALDRYINKLIAYLSASRFDRNRGKNSELCNERSGCKNPDEYSSTPEAEDCPVCIFCRYPVLGARLHECPGVREALATGHAATINPCQGPRPSQFPEAFFADEEDYFKEARNEKTLRPDELFMGDEQRDTHLP